MKLSQQGRSAVHFFLGGICVFAIIAVGQDYRGLEGYIASIRESWVNVWWPIWVVLFVAAYITHERMQKRESDVVPDDEDDKATLVDDEHA